MNFLKLFEFVKNIFFRSPVTVNVNIGKQEPDNLNIPKPDSEESLSLPTDQTNAQELDNIIESGNLNPIDEEAISDLLANLKYSKQPGDKIEIRFGNTRLNPDDI